MNSVKYKPFYILDLDVRDLQWGPSVFRNRIVSTYIVLSFCKDFSYWRGLR